MRQGDIVWVELPSGEGRAQSGRRPAVVLQDESLALSTTVLVPLTTQLAALRFPATVLLEPDGRNGLRAPSVALVFQVRAVDQQFISTGTQGTVAPAKLNELFTALDELTGR